jgi:hypothetical protein
MKTGSRVQGSKVQRLQVPRFRRDLRQGFPLKAGFSVDRFRVQGSGLVKVNKRKSTLNPAPAGIREI